MSCCGQCRGIRDEFDRTVAQRELRWYRRFGPRKSTKLLLAELRRAGRGAESLLDVGGGIGAIHHELLDGTVREATHVDASPAYIVTAAEEAERRAHGGRVRFVEGNAVELADELPPADIVTLDRVVCCYHDMPALVGATAARARRLYGLVYPRERLLTRVGIPLANAFLRLKRSDLRTFLHPTEAVERVVASHGLTRRFRATTMIWQVAVFARD